MKRMMMKREKKFSGLIALMMCMVFAFAGQSSAEEFGWPMPGRTSKSDIGPTYYYNNGNPHSTRHGFGTAIDIYAPVGTEVFAVADGKVITRKTIPGTNGYGGYDSFGKYIEIEHSDGTITLYAHLNDFNVSLNQQVKRGDMIGWSGNLGNTGGNEHLHYEMKGIDAYQYYQTNGYRDPRTMSNGSAARDKVVAYAWEIYNFKWYVFQPILKHNTNEYTGPRWVRGIPYTLYGTGDTFEQYKTLIDKNNAGVNNGLYDIVTYDIWTGESRTGMKHGMACATFVTTCIMQGFSDNAGLSMQPAIKFHTKDGWKNYISEGNKDYDGYSKLQKGDYLDNFSTHVILVVGNHKGTGNNDSYIEYIDQTPTWDDNNDIGTHKGTYYYSSLASRGYRPMYVTYDKILPDPDINPGLQKLTANSYAKAFTLTSGRYDVYSDSNLTVKLNNNYTGYDEEDRITGVGKNSYGTVYAEVSIPIDSGGRKTVYVNLRDVFVPGTVTKSGKAVNKSGGLYKRRNEGYNSNYWIDPGDTVYLLTEDNGWMQVMYPISGTSYYRIAWLTQEEYNRIIPSNEGTPIDAEHFPDSYFREYVKNFDTNGNGYFSQSELDVVIEMWEENGPHPDNGNPNNGNYGYEWIKIESIEGIKYFRNLKSLCVYRDNIKEIYLNGMEHLERLYCYGIRTMKDTEIG